MLVGILTDKYGRKSEELNRYKSILDYNNIDSIFLDVSQPDFFNRVAKTDLFIFRWHHNDDHRQLAGTILPIIEKEMGVRCFPDSNTCWHYDDKIKQYYLLKHYGFPFIDCWVFWDKREALKWVETASLPVVFKLKGGAGSRNVILISTKQQARRIIKKMFGSGVMYDNIPGWDNTRFKDFSVYKSIHHIAGNILRKSRGEDASPYWLKHKNYSLFQKYIPNNNYDTRIVVIGDRAYGEKRLNRENDFRASGGGKLIFDPSHIDTQFIKLAFEISDKLKFQSMAYDFLYDEEGNPALCEISYTFPFDLFYSNCPGQWDKNIKWHEGRISPQYLQLVKALGLNSLKHPPFKRNGEMVSNGQ
jgi:glutathione synthase/RimK-type ligase-like ATP-grasp enzyme